MNMLRHTFVAALTVLAALSFLVAQGRDDLAGYNEPPSRLRGVIEKFSQDYGALNRFYSAQTSDTRAAKMRQLYADNLSLLGRLNFEGMNHDEQIDQILFANYLRHEIKELDRNKIQLDEMSAIIPFAKTIADLEDQRRRLETINSEKTAALLDDLARKIAALPKSLEGNRPKRTVANRALQTIASLRSTLRNWYNFHNAYNPEFSWWNKKPYEAVEAELGKYSTFVAQKLVGISQDDRTTIIGDPIGREALIEELEFEMIPYTPEELVEIANKEFEWCQIELKKASREMGFGDDYMKAIETVKQKYVEPGKQPALIRDLAYQAIEFVEKNDLVTVPKLARESWRMEMMTPERQLVAPFFLGGETILVSYPTDGMTHEQKLMSMRGNNPHFSHATVFHELIPGHHLQQYMTRRYRPYREIFRTPFWGEGWALYWEFLLWDMGFHKTPEDRIGALFWRSHRAARIIFSLNFHLGKWTPEECINLLVDKVGHERDNALAEVRRSFGGDYGPLYQIAYLIGGLQQYAMHKELVDSGKMTNRAFNDALLRENRIPIEMLRAAITNQRLTRDFVTSWRFYGQF